MGDGTYGGASIVETSLDQLDLASVVAVARHGAPVAMSEEARERILASRRHVEGIIDEERPVYGVTTGFGALATTHIPTPERRELQHSVLRSHAAGMGPVVEPEVVRAMMVVRAKTLAMGFSGVSVELVEALVALLNSGLVPAVPEHGSLGASGDLAPLAHIGLCLTGEGWVLDDGEIVPAQRALSEARLEPLRLQTKEGLSLINGTDGMLGMLILALEDLGLLLRTADVTAAMSVEALLGTDRVFREELHAVRPHPGRLLLEVRPPGIRGDARHHGLRSRRRRARASFHDGQPHSAPRREGGEHGQLPRGTARLRPGFSRD